MRSLQPVARMALPSSVPKNQYRIAMRITMATATTKMVFFVRATPLTKRRETSSLYLSTLMAWLAFPMIFRFTDHSPSWVRIPDRMAGMPMKVWNRPVTRPAAMPASREQSRATHTFCPPSIIIMQTAPPVHRLPSTVRSAISSTRKVIYTPMAMIPQIRPWAAAPGSALIRFIMFIIRSPQLL